MIATQTVEMTRLVGIVGFQPHHAGRTVDAEGDFGWFVTAEFFATSIHGSHSRDSGGAEWRIRRMPHFWWAMRASIPRLLRCERSALPTELIALGDERG